MALWIRNVKHFGLKLEWRGDDRVFITSKKDGDIGFESTGGSNDPAAIGKLMKRIVSDMYDSAVAMS